MHWKFSSHSYIKSHSDRVCFNKLCINSTLKSITMLYHISEYYTIVMIFVITCHCMDYILCYTLSALINQYTANICRPYSSSNKKYIVTSRKRKISYFILDISKTLQRRCQT